MTDGRQYRPNTRYGKGPDQEDLGVRAIRQGLS